MAIGPRKRTEEPVHVGFGWDGSVIRSAVPIDNQPTAFVRRLIHGAWHEYLSPAQLVDYVALDKPELRRIVHLDNWQLLDRWWHWPLASARSSVEQAIKAGGRDRPLWTADPNAWDHEVRKACGLRDEPYPGANGGAGRHELIRALLEEIG